MLLDVETNNPISAEGSVWAISRPDHPQISGVSENTLSRVDTGKLSGPGDVGPDDLVIYEATSTTQDGVYTVDGFREGKALWKVPSGVAAIHMPRAWMKYRKKSDEREHVVVYSYAALDAEIWYGEADSREDAAKAGMDHFGADEIRTRKEHRTYSDVQVHRRKDASGSESGTEDAGTPGD